MTEPRVRVRGIYATAITALLREEHIPVVDPSDPVAARFEAEFLTGRPSVRIVSTDDRLGMEISGEAEGVDRVVSRLETLSRDTFHWWSRLPRGAVRAGRIENTEESGAIVAVAGDEGFLPYSNSEAYVTEGDRVGIQVVEPQAPWTPRRRPVVSTRPHVPGSYVHLVRDPDRSTIEAPNRELRGLIELLEPTVPDEWTVVVDRTAAAVDLSILESDLDEVTDRLAAVEQAMERAADPDEPGGVYAPETTAWYRVGREGRFALDETRGDATRTIDGHHRLKAGGNGASQAIDYLERVDATIPFDPAAVLDSFGPAVGNRVRIHHGKPTGETIVLGRGTVVDRPREDAVAVRRELSAGGSLDALDVAKEAGDTAETTFVEGRQWAPTVYRDVDGERKGTYVNIGTPIEIFPDRISYVDLYIDVIKDESGTVDVVDEDELERAAEEGVLSTDLAADARGVARSLERSLARDR